MKRAILLTMAVIILAALTLFTSVIILPAPPSAPTPTPPLGINLPDKLPRIPH